jgi:protein involved in polysaccharide export with SLBB domain
VKSHWFGLASLLVAVALPRCGQPLAAQRLDSADSRRSMVTRKELTAALEEIERGLNSSAYSSSLKGAKRTEASAIRERLEEGDLRPGDELKIDILSEPGLSTVYTITAARSVLLPGGAEIKMRGVLRSEVQTYLTSQLKQLVNDPSVTASASVRLTFSGGVNKPGFYNVPAEMLLSQAIQSVAGGPAPTAVWKKSKILRGNMVVIDGPEFADALLRGRTIDQLNVQAGDEIEIDTKNAVPLALRIGGFVSAIAGLSYLISLLFKL